MLSCVCQCVTAVRGMRDGRVSRVAMMRVRRRSDGIAQHSAGTGPRRSVRALPSMLTSQTELKLLSVTTCEVLTVTRPRQSTRAHFSPMCEPRMHRGFVHVIDHYSLSKVKIERHQFGFDTLALPGINHHE